jgi:hypothetical protein
MLLQGQVSEAQDLVVLDLVVMSLLEMHLLRDTPGCFDREFLPQRRRLVGLSWLTLLPNDDFPSSGPLSNFSIILQKWGEIHDEKPRGFKEEHHQGYIS